MKHLYLASAGYNVIESIAADIGKKNLKLIFITTAAETYEGPTTWVDKDRNALIEAGFEVTDYTFTGRSKRDIEKDFLIFDVIFVCGGNSFYLLQQVQQSDCADVIRKYVESGKIYIGSSAGSILAAPDIYPTYYLDKAAEAPKLNGYIGLNLVDVVIFPHWGSEKFKERYLNQRIEHAYKPGYKIILLTDTQYLKVESDRYQIIDVS